MFELADSLAVAFAGLVFWLAPLLLMGYGAYRAAKRVGQHMDRVERELVMLNRQIAELKDEPAGQARAGR